MAKQQTIAPVYRYYTVDLLTDEILAEIPLRNVSFECALKAAGQFRGAIPITEETDSMNLNDSTMPGNTALFVMRNGVCVWGGIIWDRQYSLVKRDLNISASEFTSYFHHRKIWKTFNHQFGATVNYTDDDGWRVILDNGSNVIANSRSTVKLEFFEPENMKFNGYYRVADTPAPTTDGFTMVGGAAVADITATQWVDGWLVYYTKENHGYNTGDVITITLTAEDGEPYEDPFTAERVIESDGPATNVFRANLNNFGFTSSAVPMEGVAYRALPEGTYEDVTVTVRQDAFDYVRTLIDAMFDDFVTTDFPNVYIEPGISTAMPIINKQALDGYAILQTAGPHGVAPGQAIQVKDLGTVFDGEFEVSDTPYDDIIVYPRGGTVSSTAVSPTTAIVTTVQSTLGVATITTSTAHGFSVGQNVTLEIGDPYGDFAGTWEITEVTTPTKFTFNLGSNKSHGAQTLSYATTTVAGDPVNEVTRVEVKSNTVTLELKDPVVYSVGDTVAVANVNRDLEIVEKSLDAPNSKAMVLTAEDHGLNVGDTVLLSGLIDTNRIVSKTTTTSTVTLTTNKPHNFRKGQAVAIRGTDRHKITNKVLSSNVATLTTQYNHNVSVGTEITVTDLRDNYDITTRRMTNNVAVVGTSSNHNFAVNDTILIEGLSDTYTVVSKEATKGTVTLTLSIPHNIIVGSKLKVTGVGAPFDGTEIVVTAVTGTRVSYKIDSKYWDTQKQLAAKKGKKLVVPVTVPQSKATGTLTNIESFYNGQHIVTATTATSVSFSLPGEDQPLRNATGTKIKLSGPSAFNGVYTVTARTNNTLSYARTGNNMTSKAVPLATGDEVQPLLSLVNIHDGNRTLTAVTPTTFTFAQTMPSATSHPVSLEARFGSIFNGTRTITEVPTTDRFVFSLPGYTANVYERSLTQPAWAKASGLYNGSFTITAVDTTKRTIKYAKTLSNFGSKPVLSRGRASVEPLLIVSTFGPFPGNADIGMDYDSRDYTGINLEATAYRGFELKTVGEALDAYSDNINGFEYRIDCAYDAENDKFTKKFMLLPINFPNAPAAGEVAPITRYDADKIVFEFPGGNIEDGSLGESAENSATRFFAVGETDLGPEAGPNIGIASSSDLLQGKTGRKWPILDASETISGVNDEEELYGYAQRYLSEAAPPYMDFQLSLNGSIAPFVGDYRPGDWCSIIINDPWVQMRMKSGMEPRDDIMVRKISSFSVSVPDGVTFPERVTMKLVAEWEVDTRGQ